MPRYRSAVFHMSNAPARSYVAFSAILALSLCGCASIEPQTGTAVSVPVPSAAASRSAEIESTTTAERVASIALAQVGVPYRYGGKDRSGFDCSGLVHYAYSGVGVLMPRTTHALWSSLQPVEIGDLETGDILFFDIEGKISHVGLYLGDGNFVHAPSSGRTVSQARLDQPFYRQALVRGGRP